MDVQLGMSTARILPLRGEPRSFDGATPSGEGPLASLAAGPMSGRFCAWRGASDQRYVASVYALDRGAADGGLPDFDAFVLIAVTRTAMGRRILAITAIERSSDRRAAVAHGMAIGADEWHVHFLADDRRARAVLVADLRARHAADTAEARCA